MSFRYYDGEYYLSDEQYQNLFKGQRAAEAGRKGGLKSGETRRRKAQIKAAAQAETLKLTADTVYTKWLTDVTTEELKEFIRWRGQRKRKATLAKTALESLSDEEEEESLHETVEESLKRIRFTKRVSIRSWSNISFTTIGFDEARELYRHNYKQIAKVFYKIIDIYQQGCVSYYSE